MANTVLELFILVLSILSILVGVFGFVLTFKCKAKRIKPAVISIQLIAVLLAIAHAILQATKGLDLEYTVILYLALNSSFLLLVQIVAALVCMPKNKDKCNEAIKARVRVSGDKIIK